MTRSRRLTSSSARARGAGNYNDGRKPLKKAGNTVPEHAITMAGMISNAANPRDFEAQMQGDEPNEKEWRDFLVFFEEWKKQKPSRTGKSRNPSSSEYWRPSKAAVDYTVDKLDARIHFILPSDDKGTAARKDHNYHTTDAELRYVYRNRDRLKERVAFYGRDWEPTSAPWDDPAAKDAWEAYEAQRQSKHGK